jgi:hypothetical protein
VEGVLVASNHFQLLKRAQSTPISNRMSPFRSFYDNSFDTKCPGLRPKIYNTLCQHRSLLRQRYRAAYDKLPTNCSGYPDD